jgi:hypothetical protein
MLADLQRKRGKGLKKSFVLIVVLLASMGVPTAASAALPRLTSSDAQSYAQKNLKAVFQSFWTSGSQRQVAGWFRISRTEGRFDSTSWVFDNYRFRGWTEIKYIRVDGTLYWDNKFRIVRKNVSSGQRCVYRLRYGRGNPLTVDCA